MGMPWSFLYPEAMNEVHTLLLKLGIPYQEFTHSAVFTCEESDRLCPPMPGSAHTKQLLMRDKKGTYHVLAIVMSDKKVDVKELGRTLQKKDLGFASPERLKRLLGVDPGSVTPFGLMFDHNHEVNVIVDEDAWAMGKFRFHPLVNTATLIIDRAGFETFLAHTRHEYRIMKIPKVGDRDEGIGGRLTPHATANQ